MSETDRTVQSDARLFYQLRQNTEVSELIDAIEEFECEISELHDEEVREKDDGTLVVFLRLQKTDADHYLVCGTFTETSDESYDVGDVWIEKAEVHGPLAGRGTRWKFNGSDIVERDWIS